MKLFNGDCFEIMKEFENNSIDCIITDPPYYSTCLEFDKEPRIDFNAWFDECFRVLKSNGVLVCFSDFRLAREISLRPEFWYEIIWKKTMAVGFLDANQRPLRAHEYILIFSKEKKKSTYNPQKTKGEAFVRRSPLANAHYGKVKERVPTVNKGDRFPLSVQEWSNNNNEKAGGGLHPTQKPLAACEWLVKTYSNEKDFILDPFMGSGSTGEAAIRNGRKFIGIEKDKKYFDIAEERLNNKAGLLLQLAL